MKRKVKINNRPRLDIILMFVCVFAIFGGVSVLRSFADSAPVDVTKTGTMILEKPIISPTTDSQVSNKYYFAVQAGQRYCFWGTYEGDISIILEIKSTNQQPISKVLSGSSLSPTELICFDASSSTNLKFKLNVTGKASIGSLVSI